ncbi:lysine--tRNA ligase [Pseudokineococcus basanitobsidens]|uniref:Lysine--tRNA ligase n=1 Tax=Pseudokineococcus basanitobsidens TaxID=1926649 RepID=A0ABU8RGP2_9ACTN
MEQAPSETSPSTGPEGVTEQERVRRDKRERLLAEGGDPYPVGVPRTTTLAAVRERHAGLGAQEVTDDEVSVTGRVVFQRGRGKLFFAVLQEGGGAGTPAGDGEEGRQRARRLQVMLAQEARPDRGLPVGVGPEALAAWKADVDLGDHVGVTGRVVTSGTGELSVLASSWRMASKALRPLPNLYEGAEMSEEARVRARHLDLVVRQRAADVVRTRAAVVRSLRDELGARDFLEVETPMLQTLHGGASARPFSTRSNAFDLELFLRIAPELFLKRCVVGGLDRVFEINRNFRNEGADSTHSPEFAMLEMYQAYGDYDVMADLTRELVQAAVRATRAVAPDLLLPEAEELLGEWGRLTMYGSLSDAAGQEVTPGTSASDLLALAGRVGLPVGPDPAERGHGKLVEHLWEHLVVPTLPGPTFVRDFPVETSPLVRAHRSQEGVVEKWDLYVRGFELATGYSELVDPVVQRQRFVEQARLAAGGDPEAMVLDEDFLAAMEAGMPPTGGVGLGVDRLLMALTGLGIRETVLFPLVRPEK